MNCNFIKLRINLNYLTGLFHKAISQSGVALNPWASVVNPKIYAYRLCELLGNKTENHQEIINFLKTIPCTELIKAQEKILTHEV